MDIDTKEGIGSAEAYYYGVLDGLKLASKFPDRVNALIAFTEDTTDGLFALSLVFSDIDEIHTEELRTKRKKGDSMPLAKAREHKLGQLQEKVIE